MRRLFLLRHARARGPDATGDDFGRRLASEGRRAARHMAEFMRDHGLCPEFFLCSAAIRARQTWEILDPVISGAAGVAVEGDLYLASSARLLGRLGRVQDRITSVMLIGHNPGIGSLAGLLVGGGNKAALADLRRDYPPGALAVIDLDIASWREIAAGVGSLDAFVTPRALPIAAPA